MTGSTMVHNLELLYFLHKYRFEFYDSEAFEERTGQLATKLQIAAENTAMPIAPSSALLIVRAIAEFSLKSGFRSLMDEQGNLRFITRLQEFVQSHKALLGNDKRATERAKEDLIFIQPEIPEVLDIDTVEEAKSFVRRKMTLKMLNRIPTAGFEKTQEESRPYFVDAVRAATDFIRQHMLSCPIAERLTYKQILPYFVLDYQWGLHSPEEFERQLPFL